MSMNVSSNFSQSTSCKSSPAFGNKGGMMDELAKQLNKDCGKKNYFKVVDLSRKETAPVGNKLISTIKGWFKGLFH